MISCYIKTLVIYARAVSWDYYFRGMFMCAPIYITETT